MRLLTILILVLVTGCSGASTLPSTPSSERSPMVDDPSLPQQLQSGFCQSGDTIVYGRQIHYKACSYFKGFFRLRYKCTATDVATGISVEARGYQSGKGAVEAAVQELIKTLVQRGIIPPPAI